jgi:hypothetical protein
VDAGVTQIDIETKKMKEEQKLREAQTRAISEHGELALITVEGPQSTTEERISLRPPMLQVKKCLQFLSYMEMIADIQGLFSSRFNILFLDS